MNTQHETKHGHTGHEIGHRGQLFTSDDALQFIRDSGLFENVMTVTNATTCDSGTIQDSRFDIIATLHSGQRWYFYAKFISRAEFIQQFVTKVADLAYNEGRQNCYNYYQQTLHDGIIQEL
jgi:hypothetical protein